MKIKIYDEAAPEEKVLRLRLIERRGEAVVVAVKDNGDLIAGGYLLSITPPGKVWLPSSISDTLGLPLDEYGRLRVVNLTRTAG